MMQKLFRETILSLSLVLLLSPDPSLGQESLSTPVPTVQVQSQFPEDIKAIIQDVDSGQKPPRSSVSSMSQRNGSGQLIFKNSLDLKQSKRMGFAGIVGGPLGAFGIFTELNLEPMNSAIAGFGVGPGYNSFLFSWKHSFSGNYLAPYTQLGYSRWFGTGHSGDPGESTILRQVLTSGEISDGKFGKDFIVGSLGIQYTQLRGETLGLGFFMQFDVMFAPEEGYTLPNGAVGSIYYL